MGKIMTHSITWALEMNKKLPPNQAGFREGKSVLDHILTLEAKIKEGFNRSLITYAIYLDLCHAYDSTWHKAIQYKMAHLQIEGKTLKWVKSVSNEGKCK